MVYETLKRTVQALRTGARDFTSVENSARHALMGAGFDINYFSILDEKNLHPAQEETTAFRVVSRTTISDKARSARMLCFTSSFAFWGFFQEASDHNLAGKVACK